MNIKNRELRNIIILYGIAILYWITLVIYREITKKTLIY